MELFERTSPQQKKVVSVVIPGGSKVQRTGFGFPGQEKEKKLMIHVAEHGFSGTVLPWSHLFLVLSQSDFFFFKIKGYTRELETGMTLREDGEFHCLWQL